MASVATTRAALIVAANGLEGPAPEAVVPQVTLRQGHDGSEAFVRRLDEDVDPRADVRAGATRP